MYLKGLGHGDLLGNCRLDELPRKGTTIEISDAFSTLRILLGICRFIIDNAIMDLVNCIWAASDMERGAQSWIRGAWWLCLNYKEVGSTLLLGLLRGIVLKDLMRGILVLDILLIISTEAVEMRRRMRLSYTVLCICPAFGRTLYKSSTLVGRLE